MRTFHHAFKFDYEGLVASLITPVLIDEATITRKRDAKYVKINGLWDTGATSSVIVPEVAEHLNLMPIGKTTVSGVNSTEEANIYLVDIVLPNNVGFSNVKMIGSNFVGGEMLIGMDVIQAGDFSISNGGGKTHFSYCIPSHRNKTCLYEKSIKVNK